MKQCKHPELTYAQKVALYNNKRYSFLVPPVCSTQWDRDAWIKWVDKEGHWITGETK